MNKKQIIIKEWTHWGGKRYLMECNFCKKHFEVQGKIIRRKQGCFCSTQCSNSFNGKLKSGKNHPNFSHGMAKTNFYRVWALMKNRCLSKKSNSYKNYGKRGIKVCKKWISFDNFYNDMYKSYLEHYDRHEGNTFLERTNNNDNYYKENCRWATMLEQQNNTRKNHKITYNGITLNLSQWARKLGIKRTTLQQRITAYHWPISKAFSKK